MLYKILTTGHYFLSLQSVSWASYLLWLHLPAFCRWLFSAPVCRLLWVLGMTETSDSYQVLIICFNPVCSIPQGDCPVCILIFEEEEFDSILKVKIRNSLSSVTTCLPPILFFDSRSASHCYWSSPFSHDRIEGDFPAFFFLQVNQDSFKHISLIMATYFVSVRFKIGHFWVLFLLFAAPRI